MTLTLCTSQEEELALTRDGELVEPPGVSSPVTNPLARLSQVKSPSQHWGKLYARVAKPLSNVIFVVLASRSFTPFTFLPCDKMWID